MSGYCCDHDSILIRILYLISSALNAQIVELWTVENDNRCQRICACQSSGDTYSSLQTRCRVSNTFCELLEISAKQYHLENVPDEVGRTIYEDFSIHFTSLMAYRLDCPYPHGNNLHVIAYSMDSKFQMEPKLDYLLRVQEVLFVAIKQLYEEEDNDDDDVVSDGYVIGNHCMDELDLTHHYVDQKTLRPKQKRAPHGMFSIMEESEEDTDDEINMNEVNFCEKEQIRSNTPLDELDSKNYVPIHRVKVDGKFDTSRFDKLSCNMPKVTLNRSGESTDSILLTPRESFSSEDCCFLDCEGNSTIHLHDENTIPKVSMRNADFNKSPSSLFGFVCH